MSDLWLHQIDAIKVAAHKRDLALFWEMGTGKSRATVEIIRRKFAYHERVMRTLILCPSIVCDNWRDEWLKFSKIKDKDILVLNKSQKHRCEVFTKNMGENLENGKIVVTNYEAMEMKDLFQLIKTWQPEILVCDESQRLKSPTSKRAKKVLDLAMSTRHNFLLSGTPVLNSPLDLFMQFCILDRGETFGKNFFIFRAMYFEDANEKWKGRQNYFPKWQIRPNASDEIRDKIKEKSLRVVKSECLTLPPFVRQSVYTELSPQQIKAYKEMYNDYITFIESADGSKPSAVVAQLAITKALRLQQIVAGFVKDDDGNILRLDCPRMKVLEELLLELTPEHKVIVWSEFKENQKMIADLCTSLNLGYREIHGDVAMNTRYQAMEEFRKDSSVRVMIANQGAAGVGVNLVEASYSIYYSKGFKLENDLQSEARNFRGGSEMHKKITRIDIVARGTIDELITQALQNKQDIQERILTWKKELKLS